jgi:hypothetical protein
VGGLVCDGLSTVNVVERVIVVGVGTDCMCDCLWWCLDVTGIGVAGMCVIVGVGAVL